MDAKHRRAQLLEILRNAPAPTTGADLAKLLAVSRQIVVGDIAILRASGHDIYATPQGYLLPHPVGIPMVSAKLACRHGKENLLEELAIIIDNGGKVLDVIVEHPIYGEIKANLMLASRRDLQEFAEKLSQSGASPLSVVTGGVHLHTVEAPSASVLDQIREELRRKKILFDSGEEL